MNMDKNKFGAISDYLTEELNKLPKEYKYLLLASDVPEDDQDESGNFHMVTNVKEGDKEMSAFHPYVMGKFAEDNEENFISFLATMMYFFCETKFRQGIIDAFDGYGYTIEAKKQGVTTREEVIDKLMKGLGVQGGFNLKFENLVRYTIDEIKTLPDDEKTSSFVIFSRQHPFEKNKVASQAAYNGTGVGIVSGIVSAMEEDEEGVKALIFDAVLNCLKRGTRQQYDGFLENLKLIK